MKKVLITGAGGFVGPHLIRFLQSYGNTDIYCSAFSSASDISELVPLDHIITGDLTRFADADTLIRTVQPDIIYHLASLSAVGSSVENAARVLTANTLLQYNLLESLRLNRPQARLLAVCSANEYGLVHESEVPISESQPLRPLNPYAVSKVAQEMLALQYHYAHGLDTVILRPFNHTGEGQTSDFVIPALAEQFVRIAAGSREPVIEVGNTASIRDFTDVKDMVRAYVLAVEKCESGEVYNVGYGKGISIADIIKLFEEISGLSVTVKQHPGKVRASDVPVLLSDSGKFRAATGWEPEIKLKDTLTRVYNYYRNRENK